MCKYFLASKCANGKRCPFAHRLSEIRQKPNLFCTSMCPSFLRSGNCENPGCTFAHTERELRATAGFFKTKMCRFAGHGRCKHGENCRFAHSPDDLQALAPGQSAPGGAGQPQTPGQPGDRQSTQDNFELLAATNGQQRQSSADAPSDISTWSENPSTSDEVPRGSGQDSASDQSTRAETRDWRSVPTPEGSGDDSGQEESWPPGGRRQSGRHSGHSCTTIMVTGVPDFLTQGALLSMLEDLTISMRGTFDLFYCPWNPNEDCNLGYAIINFCTRVSAAEFERQWANQSLLPAGHGAKRLKIMPASLQGRAANLRHFSGFELARHPDPRFRPLVRAGPHEMLRPMAITPEINANQTRQQQEQQQQEQQQQQQQQHVPGLLRERPQQVPVHALELRQVRHVQEQLPAGAGVDGLKRQ